MNTVLDDNMMLCLANSDRIKLKPELRMVFEVWLISLVAGYACVVCYGQRVGKGSEASSLHSLGQPQHELAVLETVSYFSVSRWRT